MLKRLFNRTSPPEHLPTTSQPRRPALRVEQLEERALMAADVVIQWNNLLLDAFRTTSLNPPLASRALAIVHLAVYDAVNAIDRTHKPYLVSPVAPPKASIEAAAVGAAHRAMVSLFPGLSATFDAALTANLATIPDGPSENAGLALGRSVADQILAHRANDGSVNTLPPFLGGTDPGDWRPTPPANAPGLLPNYPNVTPFAMTSGSQFSPDGIPALDSAEYAAALNEVKDLGSATSATRTADQTAIALFWANGGGTSTPPGHLNRIAQIVAEARGTTLVQNARLFALLNLAEADAAISCWDTKFATNFWRPVTGIRLADTDGNDATAADPSWLPLIVTPPFPSYSSGHSTFSGAAQAVLTSFFGTDNVTFTLPSENPGVGDRTFTSFSQASLESANSRLYGGIHWSFDNIDGLAQGNALGAYVFANFLRPAALAPAASLVGNTLVVLGGSGKDVLQVVKVGTRLLALGNGRVLGSFDASLVQALAIDGKDGNDVITVGAGISIGAELYGGRGNDALIGGAGNDRLFGEEGTDVLFGMDGNDVLDGGAGIDILFGGLGDDDLYGGPGVDVLFGGPGNNRLFPDGSAP
jgi:hypothetical protein